MSKKISTHFDELLKNMTMAINDYEVSKVQENINKIKEYFIDIFDVKYVTLWKYNAFEKKIVSVICKENLEIEIEASLIKSVIKSKRPKIENHIISHKVYNPKIDNPFEYPLKSMIIYPILEDGVVQGILTLAKDMRQRILFEREEIVRVEKFQTVLLSVIKSYQVPSFQDNQKPTKKVALVKEEQEAVETTVIEERKSIPYTEIVKPKDEKLHLEMLALKEEISYLKATLVEKEEKNTFLEKEIIAIKSLAVSKVEKYDEKSQLEMIALKEEIDYLKAKDEVTLEIEQTNKRYLEMIEQMTISQKISQKQVAYLEIKVQKFEEEKVSFNNQNESISRENGQVYDTVIEPLLIQTLPNLVKYEQIYILYELIMYELEGSSIRLNDIENKIKKSNLLSELLQSPQYVQSSHMNIKITNMSMFLTKLKILQEKCFAGRMKVEITLSSKVPAILNFDRKKVLNLCFHLLGDIVQFIDVKSSLLMTLDYVDNSLHVRIKGKKHASLSRLLYRNKFTINLKERIALAMSKKLVEIVSGELESYMEDDYCIHQLVIPANKS